MKSRTDIINGYNHSKETPSLISRRFAPLILTNRERQMSEPPLLLKIFTEYVVFETL